MDNYWTKMISVLMALTLLASCSALNSRDKLPDQYANIVATDFISALSMMRGYSPRNTTVQIRPTRTEFGESLVNELRRVGYGLQMIAEDDTGPLLMTYEADTYENSTHKSVAYRLQVGGVELGREYEVRPNNVFPITSMSVKGVVIGGQALDQSIFERTVASESVDQAELVLGRAQAATSTTVPSDRWQVVRAESVIETPTKADLIQSGENQQHSTTVSGQKPKRNVLMLGESNFSVMFSKYVDRNTGILAFGNDSTDMGLDMKLRTKALIRDFDPQRDIVSLIGCSHGKTAVVGGNQTLALARAESVKQELILLKVPETSIYDEGCWAGFQQKSLPARGVIVTVKRRIESS